MSSSLGTPFTAPRRTNRWTWVYRIRPSAMHRPFHQIPRVRLIRSGPFNEVVAPPNQLRWQPLPDSGETNRFCGRHRDPRAATAIRTLQTGAAIHFYAANTSMRDRFFYNADGELLIVPQLGDFALSHRMRSAGSGSRRNLRDPARYPFPGRTFRASGSRIHLRKLRPASSITGAGADRHAGPGELARFPHAGSGL